MSTSFLLHHQVVLRQLLLRHDRKRQHIWRKIFIDRNQILLRSWRLFSSLAQEAQIAQVPSSSNATVLDVMLARGLRPAQEIDISCSVREAVAILTERRTGSAVAVDAKRVMGVFTARDILAWIHCDGGSHDKILNALNESVSKVMTSSEKVAWCAPRDKLSRVRSVMRALGVRNMPVLCTASSAVIGMLTANDLADYSLELKSGGAHYLGGKESFLRATTGRSGLPNTSQLIDPNQRKLLVGALTQLDNSNIDSVQNYFSRNNESGLLDDDIAALRSSQGTHTKPTKQRTAGGFQRFELRYGVQALPNPLKQSDGNIFTGRSGKVRAYLDDKESTESQFSADADLSEDAHFVLQLPGLQYVGVFDGVGSWRKLGVDPRLYPRALAHAVATEIEDAVQQQKFQNTNSTEEEQQPLLHDMLYRAWRSVTQQQIPGSTTACIVTIDHQVNALSYVNLGDSGLVVLRRASSLGTATIPDDDNRRKDKSRRHLVLVAPQQLRAFNLPYQLGWTNSRNVDSESSTQQDNENSYDDGLASFETPAHANVASFPLQDQDIIIVATDGLFDNVSVDHITDIVAEWEKSAQDLSVAICESPHTVQTQATDSEAHVCHDLSALAHKLAHTARTLSLDEHTDSPFALLAKDNDILWSGGMPDDVTVIALRVHVASSNNNETVVS